MAFADRFFELANAQADYPTLLRWAYELYFANCHRSAAAMEKLPHAELLAIEGQRFP